MVFHWEHLSADPHEIQLSKNSTPAGHLRLVNNDGHRGVAPKGWSHIPALFWDIGVQAVRPTIDFYFSQNEP